jgi:ribosomal protein L39E
MARVISVRVPETTYKQMLVAAAEANQAVPDWLRMIIEHTIHQEITA